MEAPADKFERGLRALRKYMQPHLSELAAESMDEVIRRSSHSRIADVHLRADAVWDRFEADWIKYLPMAFADATKETTP